MPAFDASRRDTIRLALAACAAALLAAAAPARAGEAPYTAPALARALAAGTPTIVHFRASWCPTCKAQQPIVDALLREPARKDLLVLAADFDTETALKKRLRITQQSTFVVFKGGREVARSTGETKKDAIAALFDQAL
jgi:thiol-disulfide isomerase/thioredoxin